MAAFIWAGAIPFWRSSPCFLRSEYGGCLLRTRQGTQKPDSLRSDFKVSHYLLGATIVFDLDRLVMSADLIIEQHDDLAGHAEHVVVNRLFAQPIWLSLADEMPLTVVQTVNDS